MNQPQNPYEGQRSQWGNPQPSTWTPPPNSSPWGQPPPSTNRAFEHDANTMAAHASPAERARFIERTYLHLALAISVFVLLEVGLQAIPGLDYAVMNLLSFSRYSWLLVLGAFVGVSWIADSWASSSSSKGMQYAGLILYTVAEAVIFVPLVFVAKYVIGPEGLVTAGGVTMAMFAAMTGYVFLSKQNFSFLRGALSVASMAALGLITASIVFGFNLGILFTVAMIAMACGYILYFTSNILHQYRVDQHVAAALALFSAVALLFWYVLRLMLSWSRD